MTIWEYQFIEVLYDEPTILVDNVPVQGNFDQLIHQAGREGWELVSLTETRTSLLAVLKR